MLGNLHITDLSPASGEVYWCNRQWCAERGARLHEGPVSIFDYRHMLAKISSCPLPRTFDLIIGFGLCLGVFDGAGRLRGGETNSSVARQYRFLASGQSSRQQLFSEALMGQSVNTTHVLIHQYNHAHVSPVPMSYPSAKIRLYNPEGGRRVHMRMGSKMTDSSAPLVCNVSGPGTLDALTHVRTTPSLEQQLDVQSAIMTTLWAGGSVLVLGCGEMRFLRTLDALTHVTGRPIRQPGYSGAYGKYNLGPYFDFVLTQPVGTADQDESVVGRVNLKRLRQWVDNGNATYVAAPAAA